MQTEWPSLLSSSATKTLSLDAKLKKLAKKTVNSKNMTNIIKYKLEKLKF